MKPWLTINLVILLMISGCASDPSVNDISNSEIAQQVSTLGLRNETPIPKEAEKLLRQSTPCCKELSEIPYKKLELNRTKIVKMNGSFASFEFDDGKSFITAFQLPQTNRPITLEIQSIAASDKVFAPKVLALNENFTISRSFGNEYFQYKPASFLKGERLEASIEDIGGFKDETYLIVYSPSENRAGSTMLVHPAKQFARTQNRVEPDIPDPVAKHSALGVITLYASTGQSGESTSTPLVIPKEQEISPEIFVNEKIRQAVAEGRIDEAMSLVEDAEANGSTTARQTFIDAVKSGQQK